MVARKLEGESAAVPGLSPWECLVRAAAAPDAAGKPLFLWEAPRGEALAGIGAGYRITAEGPGRFDEIRRELSPLLAGAEHRGPSPDGFPGAVAIGGFAFAEQGARRGWPGFPDALFYIPSRMFWRSPAGETVETRWTANGWPPEEALPDAGDGYETGEPWQPHARPPEPDPSTLAAHEMWPPRVRATLDRIRSGEFSKAVLARSVRIELRQTVRPIAIMASLRAAYPECYRFLIADGRGNAFLGASPERLVRLAGGVVLTEAVAGTLRCEPGEDASALERDLIGSRKDQSEHRIVLDHLLEILTPACESLHVPESPDVMRLPHLLHLRTPVRGRARAGAHVLDLVSRLHPTPAVAGWPRREALSWIASVESEERGWYAGPMGWVGAGGDGDFAVGIRSIAIRGQDARLFAGAGIVEGSDPGLEWNETGLKMKGILDAITRD